MLFHFSTAIYSGITTLYPKSNNWRSNQKYSQLASVAMFVASSPDIILNMHIHAQFHLNKDQTLYCAGQWPYQWPRQRLVLQWIWRVWSFDLQGKQSYDKKFNISQNDILEVVTLWIDPFTTTFGSFQYKIPLIKCHCDLSNHTHIHHTMNLLALHRVHCILISN